MSREELRDRGLRTRLKKPKQRVEARECKSLQFERAKGGQGKAVRHP